MLDWRSTAPAAMCAALEALSRVPVGEEGRRIAVLGEMATGDRDVGAHCVSLGRQAARSRIDYLYCCGETARRIYKEAVKGGFDRERIVCCTNARELEQQLRQQLRRGDALLVKGDGGAALMAVVRKLFGIPLGAE